MEQQGQNVLVRAAQDNFSERRKAFLIRQLAAEGYIPDQFEGYVEYAPVGGLLWVVDRSLLIVGPEATGRTRRFMSGLLAGGCLLWLLELTFVFLRA